MSKVVFGSLLLLASAAALPETCTPTQNQVDWMNGLEFVHLTSYCTVQRIIEEVNSPTPEDDSYALPRWVCNNMKKLKNVNLKFAIDCISQGVGQAGDTYPLDSKVIKKRITFAAGEFVQNFSDKDKCSHAKLENLNYEEAMKKFKNYDHCMYKEIVKDLAKADILVQPSLNVPHGNDVINLEYYDEYGFSDPNADYKFS